jgi:hypothetical protein
MKRLFSLTFLFLSFCAFTQYDIDKVQKDTSVNENKLNLFKLKENIYVGGEFGLSLSNISTYVFVAPFVGYDITEKFSAGISGMYQFSRVRWFSQTATSHAYGGGVFLRYFPIKQLIVQSEFDLYNAQDFFTQDYKRVNVPAFMSGLGYANYLGEDAYYQILLMYDFIQDKNMPLPDIVIPGLHLKFGLVWHL